jgi:hypothetical protein
MSYTAVKGSHDAHKPLWLCAIASVAIQQRAHALQHMCSGPFLVEEAVLVPRHTLYEPNRPLLYMPCCLSQGRAFSSTALRSRLGMGYPCSRRLWNRLTTSSSCCISWVAMAPSSVSRTTAGLPHSIQSATTRKLCELAEGNISNAQAAQPFHSQS